MKLEIHMSKIITPLLIYHVVINKKTLQTSELFKQLRFIENVFILINDSLRNMV